VPSPALYFLVEYEWDKLYQAKDADYIMLIQDTYDCCGLNSVDDRAYPFFYVPGGTCAEIHARTRACRGPWMGALQAASGIDFGVVVVVGLMQVGVIHFVENLMARLLTVCLDDWSLDHEGTNSLVDCPQDRGLEAI
jgi:hypothetical protein